MEANERALLNSMLASLSKVDPDVIAGHNVLGAIVECHAMINNLRYRYRIRFGCVVASYGGYKSCAVESSRKAAANRISSHGQLLINVSGYCEPIGISFAGRRRWWSFYIFWCSGGRTPCL